MRSNIRVLFRGQSERPIKNEGKIEHKSSNQHDIKCRKFVKTKIRLSKNERRTIERQIQRTFVQNLFKRSPAAEALLSGDYKEESKTAPVEELVNYRGKFSQKTQLKIKDKCHTMVELL